METILRLPVGVIVDLCNPFRAVVALQAPSSCRICRVRVGFVPELGAPIRKATRRSRGRVSFDSHAVDCFSASSIELRRNDLELSRSETNSLGAKIDCFRSRKPQFQRWPWYHIVSRKHENAFLTRSLLRSFQVSTQRSSWSMSHVKKLTIFSVTRRRECHGGNWLNNPHGGSGILKEHVDPTRLDAKNGVRSKKL
jgi:hypothetical protein